MRYLFLIKIRISFTIKLFYDLSVYHVRKPIRRFCVVACFLFRSGGFWGFGKAFTAFSSERLAFRRFLSYNKGDMFHIVLVEPEIPQNAGNIARTCAATGSELHLVKPLGFEISDKYLKRAGLDYWNLVKVHVHEDLGELFSAAPDGRFFFFTTKARRAYTEVSYRDGDYLVFGKETRGLEEELLVAHADSCVRIPMIGESRSLNLSNAAAIAVYEALRQNRFCGLSAAGDLHRLQWT